MSDSTAKMVSDMRLVGRYVPSDPHYCPDAPTVAKSLEVFRASPRFQSCVARQEGPVDCLFQGYTSPKNADALRDTLSGLGITNTGIVAVDQIHLPQVYAELGVPMPDIEFVHANACALGSHLDDRKFDFIVQDFILNCLAPGAAPALLTEAKRHLKPDGAMLVSFSADVRAPAARTKTLAALLEDWPHFHRPLAGGLHDVARDNAELEDMKTRLSGHSIFDAQTGHLTHVTNPSGQFEFFVPKAEVIDMFCNAGFEISIAGVQTEVDYNDLECTRYRIIASHAAP